MEEIVTSDSIAKRADLFVVNLLKQNGFEFVTRSFLQKNWEYFIHVNSMGVKPSYKLRGGDIVTINTEIINEKINEDSNMFKILPQKGELKIIFENDEYLIINKKSGVVVHPGSGNTNNTLSNHIMYYLQQKKQFDPRIKRAGIVHRLDKGVSGLILFAKTLESQQYLQKQFAQHQVVKMYIAKINKDPFSLFNKTSQLNTKDQDVMKILVEQEHNGFKIDSNWIKIEGYIKRSNINRMKMQFIPISLGPNGGKYSCTYILPLNKNEILVRIETGRMHQIRATLEFLGVNIINDSLYATKKGKGGVPEEIELKSILISFLKQNEERVTYNLLKNEKKK